ncbi:carbohydrate ABC transporter membrane protein 1, CUT1 family [Allokutzneria albata]|uniref:Carbohydrate ABC transporter membrane protein 1, CUT1 family n=1 Tax=Allokutzneria albata TaxID=211114 RepID=A0A1H0AUC4_ALLAB|nr:sugar ABC transporter permease [Allokutzneria albata]SDN36673.1 carbohydrate ABC transporter membrane protein 1, CUT1 family [Allokutzneria albata]
MRRRPFGERALPYLLLAPAVLALLVMLGWPALQVVLISFRKLDLGELVRGEVVWTGFDNYAEVLGDPDFWSITLRTVLFTAGCVAGTVLAGLGIAVLMRHIGPKVRIVLQITLVLAWAVPILAATTVFQWIFDQQYGILNKTLVLLGFESFSGHSWFATGASTMVVIGLLIVWQAVPFIAFTLYAGLLSVPRDLYEAAGMDGASGVQTFRAVTWPSIAPLVTMSTFLSVLWDFKVFAQVWAIREGGPDGGSTTLPVLQYLKGIASSHFGVAAAVAVVMTLVLVVFTAQYLRMLLRSGREEL